MRLTILVTVLVLLLLVWLFCPLQAAVVVGGSMEPTLHHHQVVLVDRTAYRSSMPRVGDVILFHEGGEILVKRVRAIAGQRVVRYASYPSGESAPWKIKLVRRYVRVPVDCVFVDGDNPNSESSYDFGPVPMRAVIGKVIAPTVCTRNPLPAGI